MLYKKTLLYNRDSYDSMNQEEKKINIKDTAKHIFDEAKGKINETFSDENIKNVKQKANEFSEDAKEAFGIISEKGSEFANEAAEHLTDLAEDAQEDIKQATVKVKNFLKKITNK